MSLALAQPLPVPLPLPLTLTPTPDPNHGQALKLSSAAGHPKVVLTILDYLGIKGSSDMTYSTPHGYRVEGAGSAEADGLYVRDGEYGGAPLFKKVSLQP